MTTTSELLNEEKENLRADAQKSPRELEREVERARSDVEHTLEALERSFSPGELLDQGLKLLRGSGSHGHGFANQLRNNPIPVLLTGIGVTWLISASNRPPESEQSFSSGGTSSGGLSDKVSRAASAVSGAASKASGAASSARGAASEAGERARAAGSRGQAVAEDAARRASDMGRGIADASRRGRDQAWQGYDYLRREQPLVLGALAIAAGALIGGLLPASDAENRYLGEYSDETKDRLKREASERAEQAKSVATDAAHAAKEEAERQTSSTSTSPGGTSNS